MNKKQLLRFWNWRPSGLWGRPAFARLWASLTITSFGGQITNLALPLTAALLLNATPFEMGLLVALELAPFALIGLFAGVWVDRLRKLPLIIVTDVARGVFLLAIPLTAAFDQLHMATLYLVGFVCGVGNVIGGAAYQVYITQIVGRQNLVEANAKIAVSQSSAELVGPGAAGFLIHALGAPFAITLDAISFLLSGWMLKGIREEDQPQHSVRAEASIWAEIMEGLRLVWHNPVLRLLAWTVAVWQFLHCMYLAVIILFASRELGFSPGVIGFLYALSGAGCLLAAVFAKQGSERFGVGPQTAQGLVLTALAWAMFAVASGGQGMAMSIMGAGMLLFGFGATLFTVNYLSLRQAITPDALLGRMTATMRFLTVAAAPVGSLFGGILASAVGLRATLWVVGIAGLGLGAFMAGFSGLRQVRRLPSGE